MNSIEERIKLFYKLSSNKWYPRFNYVLYEYMLYVHTRKTIIPDTLNDLRCFYY
jgi:hypothetical protein